MNQSRVRQRPLARALWAIDDHGGWVLPLLQFESDTNTEKMKQIRGLDRVSATLAQDLHPVAVAAFLRTAHPDLTLADRLLAPLEWLRSGADLTPVLRLVEAADRASR